MTARTTMGTMAMAVLLGSGAMPAHAIVYDAYGRPVALGAATAESSTNIYWIDQNGSSPAVISLGDVLEGNPNVSLNTTDFAGNHAGTINVIAPEPYVAADVHAVTIGNTSGGFAAAVARVQYDYAFTAPDLAAYDLLVLYLAAHPGGGGLSIGSTIDGLARVDVNGGTNGSAQVIVVGAPISTTNLSGFSQSFACFDLGGGKYLSSVGPGGVLFSNCYGSSIAYSVPGALVAGAPSSLSFFGSVTLEADVSFGDYGDGLAEIDPIIRLPSDFTGDPSGWLRRYSAGIPGSAPGTIPLPPPPDPIGGVPEPASWALLIVGFAMTGCVIRQRCADADPASKLT